MKGYTIENSIDLLEKDVKSLKEGGGGGGGASTWNQLQGKPFNTLGEEVYNLDGALTVNTISADKIELPDSSEHSWDYLSQAIEALAEDVNHFSDDISELEANKQDTLTPGSGIAIENEVISVNSIYSTDEIRIGTWIDGKPLYRKTFDLGPLPSAKTIKDVAHNIPIALLTSMSAIATNDDTYYFLPFSDATDTNYRISVWVNKTNIRIRNDIDRVGFYAYATLEYTKEGD